MSALFTQCPGHTVQTGAGNVDPAQKFKCTSAARFISRDTLHQGCNAREVISEVYTSFVLYCLWAVM